MYCCSLPPAKKNFKGKRGGENPHPAITEDCPSACPRLGVPQPGRAALLLRDALLLAPGLASLRVPVQSPAEGEQFRGTERPGEALPRAVAGRRWPGILGSCRVLPCSVLIASACGGGGEQQDG